MDASATEVSFRDDRKKPPAVRTADGYSLWELVMRTTRRAVFAYRRLQGKASGTAAAASENRSGLDQLPPAGRAP
jgi:hypothetical protein